MWLVPSNASAADWRSYEGHDVAHHHEMVDLLQAAGLGEFRADVHIDVAAGLGACIGAARETGAARATARVLAHDHAPTSEAEIRHRFGPIEFHETAGLVDAAVVAEGARVLVTCSHLLNQCVDADGQEKLLEDVRQIASQVARITAPAAEVVFLGLEPGYRRDLFTNPWHWCTLFNNENLAVAGEVVKIKNATDAGRIDKAGIILRLAPFDRLVEIDEKILAPCSQTLSFGFGTVHHPRIEVDVYRWSDGISMGERRTLLDERGVEAVLAAREDRRDRFLASEHENFEILGLVS